MKSYIIIGAGRSGISTARYLKDKDVKKITVTDGSDFDSLKKLGFGIEEIYEDEKIELKTDFNPDINFLKDYDVMILSPSVRPDAACVRDAKKLGLEIYSEFEFADNIANGKKIAVTGTNGKTTTTTLIGKIFKESGFDTYVNGNIGDAYINSAGLGDKDSVYVLEISSYQLEMSDKFKPNVSVITNITPDHLDRHGSFENYALVKANVFKNQDENDFLIINKDDETVVDLSKKAKCNVLSFSVKSEDANAYLKDKKIYININGKVSEILDITNLKLYGIHNVENVMACILASVVMGIDIDKMRESILSFTAVEHRIEFVKTVDGVDYINDSKGTNTDASITAINAMEKDTYIILGGYDKKVPFDDLIKALNDKIKGIIVLGDTREQIIDCAKKYGYEKYYRADSLEDAVLKGKELAGEGEAVLLSPASASFDMFDDYEQRGRVFKEIVNSL